MGKIIKNILFVLVGFLVISGLISAFTKKDMEVKVVPVSDIVRQVSDSKVEKAVINNGKIQTTLKDNGGVFSAELGSSTEFVSFLKDSGVDQEKIKNLNLEYKSTSTFGGFVSSALPIVLPFLLIMLFLYILMRQVQGSNNRALTFGQTSARITDDKQKKVTFAEVAGCKEAKEELVEVVEFLRHPQKFLALGAKVPRGVLLLGSPGVGKTLLARAVAGEANVPFFHLSGSEFVEMFVGVGASRVRDLFRKAKKNSPCIIFIDEIDAVGRQRGTGLGGGHDEREQTLNQILVEMDGFETETNVIVLAATNRPDVLDPALLRPGRFDRQVVIDLPDIKDREAILAVHATGKPFAEGVNLRQIAERTPGFSGADLANLLNEAALLTARYDKKEITNDEVREAVEKIVVGPERKSHLLSDKEKNITAYHEGGHALVGAVLPEATPIHKVTILSRGRAAGYTMKVPSEDRHMHTRQSFLDDIASMLGGFAAEKVVFSEITTGASSDLKSATSLARKLVTMYGMSDELGPISFKDDQEAVFLGREFSGGKDYSEATAQKIDEAVSSIIKKQLERAVEVLQTHRAYLDKLAKQLVEKETIEKDEFDAMVAEVVPDSKKVEFVKTAA
jgi:cell division protease FtsH